MPFLLNLILASSAILRTVSPAAAQSSTESSSTCPSTVRAIKDDRSAINATKSARVNSGEASPWYFSLALSDRRAANSDQNAQWLDTFITVPEALVDSEDGDATRVCVYRMEGQNATSDGESSDATKTCDGILSDECQEAMRDTPLRLSEDDECASPSSDVSEACGGMSFSVYNTHPQNFSNSDCAVDSVPHLDLPDGHKSYVVLGGTVGYLDESRDEEDFGGYDLRVQQPVPIMVQVRRPFDNGAVIEPLLFCLAPDDVVNGSREPENEFPPSGAGPLRYEMAWLSAGVVSLASALLLW